MPLHQPPRHRHRLLAGMIHVNLATLDPSEEVCKDIWRMKHSAIGVILPVLEMCQVTSFLHPQRIYRQILARTLKSETKV